MSDQSKSGTKETFTSTAEIWRWLLEKPEVNGVKRYSDEEIIYMKKDGKLTNDNYSFCILSQWSKHVELAKVMITREDLAREWNKHIAGTNFSRLEPEQSAPFDYFCKGLGL